MGQIQGDSTSMGGRLDGSLQTTAPAAADFALGVGWGSTATVSVTAGSTDQRGRIRVTANGSGLAQATATVTFTFKDGAFAARPFALVRLADNSNAVTEAQPVGQTESTTQLSWKHAVLPVAAATYDYEYIVVA